MDTYKYKQTEIKVGRLTDRQACKKTDERVDGEIVRKTDRQ